MCEGIFQTILGAIIAILTTIAIEYYRKPKIVISIAPPTDKQYDDRPARNSRFLALDVKNENLPWLFKWMSRNAASSTHGVIRFFRSDGQRLFSREMIIRWSGSKEPVPMVINLGNQRVGILRNLDMEDLIRKDIYPGESSRMDVAARFDNEDCCYGWSNDNYFSNPVWRDPDWKIDKGLFLFEVELITFGNKTRKIFRLVNDTNQNDFRIEPAITTDIIIR